MPCKVDRKIRLTQCYYCFGFGDKHKYKEGNLIFNEKSKCTSCLGNSYKGEDVCSVLIDKRKLKCLSCNFKTRLEILEMCEIYQSFGDHMIKMFMLKMLKINQINCHKNKIEINELLNLSQKKRHKLYMHSREIKPKGILLTETQIISYTKHKQRKISKDGDTGENSRQSANR